MVSRLKKVKSKKSNGTKPPPAKVEVRRQLIINEMSDGRIDLDPRGMNLLELLGWIPLHLKPEAFVASVQAQLSARSPIKKV